MIKFKPLLFPSDSGDLDLKDLTYPLFVSEKRDGIRCLVMPDGIRTRSLKDVPNKQIHEKWSHLVDYCKANDLVLDGEFDDEKATFQEVTSMTMSKDKELTSSFNIYLFDVINTLERQPFFERIVLAERLAIRFGLKIVVQHKCQDWVESQKVFDMYVSNGGEGIILRTINGPYKFGRATINENIGYKKKAWLTFDGKIVDVIEKTMVDPSAEKKINELGYSETSRKKDDRLSAETAGAFVVDWHGTEQRVALAMTDEEAKQLWIDRHKYVGKFIEFKGMLVGSKDRVRHPVMVRFRDDKSSEE